MKTKSRKNPRIEPSLRADDAPEQPIEEVAAVPAEPMRDQEPDLSAREQRIAGRAYELFEAGGREHGRHHDHWLQAEKEIHGTDSDGGSETIN